MIIYGVIKYRDVLGEERECLPTQVRHSPENVHESAALCRTRSLQFVANHAEA
jgi:hypothetical protein